ncbi:8-amino-7-oxononanoate synthase, partial [Streptomyces sp. SID5926]|nr:8-amino-7-oxononanoate synthase [Streptomyces sp. SID5926]
MTDSVDALPDSARIRERVVHVIAARTLYDESHLRPESHFEADLGIDSVIMESVLVSVREHFGLSAALPTGPATIGELVDAVGAALADAGDDRPAP